MNIHAFAKFSVLIPDVVKNGVSQITIQITNQLTVQ